MQTLGINSDAVEGYIETKGQELGDNVDLQPSAVDVRMTGWAWT